jgi:predicted PurR-regulated permease PerM
MDTQSQISFFSPRQRRWIARGMVALGIASVAMLCAGLFWVLRHVCGFLSSVIWPVALGGILALLLHPVVDFMNRRLVMKRVWATLVLYGVLLIIVFAICGWVLPFLANQTFALLEQLPEAFAQLQGKMVAYVPALGPQLEAMREKAQFQRILTQTLVSLKENLVNGMPLLKGAKNGFFEVIELVCSVAVLPIYLFYFLISSMEWKRPIRSQLSFVNSSTGDDVMFLMGEFVNLLLAFFRGQILIGTIMGACWAFGFTLIGLSFGTLIGLVMGLFNIIPYLGAILGIAITVPLAYLQPNGGLWMVGAVLSVFVAVHALEAYVLTPRIMGSRTGLHPVAIIFSIFFWGKVLGGLLGMVFAIPLSAFVVTVWRLVRHKYLPMYPQ